jgi:hypothetical protein
VKGPSRLVCLLAWILAAVVQAIFVASLPEKMTISGVDITHANHVVLVHQAFFIGCGLVLAVAAYAAKRWGLLFVVASSVLYLAHWFPFQSVHKYGLIAAYKTMVLVGSSPGLRLSSITRDVILPIAFLAAIALVALEMRGPTPSTAQT